tara:strand:- start:235 stop:699 length:465 start_codon:yes stop_codon:yes gene_type:complete
MPSSAVTKTSFHSNNEDTHPKYVNNSFKRMYYPSNVNNTNIVNAITGNKYPWLKGTIDELRLFRVVDSSGRCDNYGFYDRRGNHGESFNKEPNILYYDGPNEYMKHRKTNVAPGLVSEWNTTRGELFSGEGGELNLDSYNSLRSCGKIQASLKI